MAVSLTSIGEDALVDIFAFLEPPDILRLGQTCQICRQVATARLVWVHASKYHVISRGFPFPNTPLDDIATRELIAATTRGYGLGRRWLAGVSHPQKACHVAATSGIAVSDVRFIFGHGGNLIVIVSKSVWSVLSVWDIADGKKLCEWSPRGAIFTGFIANDDRRSEATLVVSLQLAEQQSVKILSLRRSSDARYSMEEICSVDTEMIPVTLAGDFIALSDYSAQIAIWNWRDGTRALLEHHSDNPPIIHSNQCIQVLFTRTSILVARARSIHLFPFPVLTSATSTSAYYPIAHHSFGWVDGECMSICPFLNGAAPVAGIAPISILVRGEIDDPWASTTHNLQLYTLIPDPSCHTAPYRFPPVCSHVVPSLRGALRCKKVILGKCGTAFWVQPRDHSAGGLVADAQTLPARNARCETLVAAVFPGSLNTNREVIATKIYENEVGRSWSAFDYDESSGRVVLGSSYGEVEVLYL